MNFITAYRKRISFLISLILVLVSITSCQQNVPGFSELYAKKFLRENYNDTFEYKGTVELPEKYADTYLESWKFKKYFAKKLNKEIILAVYAEDFFWDEPEYQSNYLFIKYEDTIENSFVEMAQKDFSQVGVSCDVDWIFSASPDSSNMAEYITNHYETRYAEINFSLEVTEEENASFEERLHALVYRLWKDGISGKKYFNVYFPDGSSKKYFVDTNCATVEEI